MDASQDQTVQHCPNCGKPLEVMTDEQFLWYFPDGGVKCEPCLVIYDPEDFEIIADLKGT